jgi:hypothetical protein
MVQFDAEFNFLQNGITTTLYDALTPLPWPYFVFYIRYRANYFWSQLFNIGRIRSTCSITSIGTTTSSASTIRSTSATITFGTTSTTSPTSVASTTSTSSTHTSNSMNTRIGYQY